jgi:HAD superfamily hydrolase (TIGR01509 family)
VLKLNFDAVIFDLDGVITNTAAVHSLAWKQMFDTFLKEQAQETGQPFREFTHAYDYLSFVDGKPRYKGVSDFLESRDIHLLYGSPDDVSDAKTVCGLGNVKNENFNQQINQGNLQVFDSTVTLIKELLVRHIKIGVASSSKNCKKILQAAGLLQLFETRVDGLVSDELGLKGKPEADIFTTACDNLGVDYDRSVIVEDAVSGVQAGYNGQFGLVLGVARGNNAQELKINGADIVVSDLSEIPLSDINNWFSSGLPDEQWSLAYYNYDPEKESTREALFTIGNGYMGTRGALEESRANGYSYPGTYLAGLYNRLTSEVNSKEVINEDFVNCTNWLPLTFKIGNGKWFDINTVEIKDFLRRLDFRDGTLYKKMVVKDAKGRETRIESRRFISMARPYLSGMQYTVTPLNYSGPLTIRAELDGRIINNGVERYKQLNSKHWQPLEQGYDEQTSFVVQQTNQSKITLAVAASHHLKNGNQQQVFTHSSRSGLLSTTVTINAEKNQPSSIEKIVAFYTSRDTANPLRSALNDLQSAGIFEQLYLENKKAWSDIWQKIDIRVDGQRLVQKLIRLNLYHSLVTVSPHNACIDAGIPARGLHGEAYRGHIFWDELFILPLYFMHFPETAKAVLMYRYKRLDAARAYAQKHDYRGAMFPWQSGSEGIEETQTLHLNPLSGEWGKDYSSLQRHVSLAIAYNIYHYFRFTNDLVFLQDYGAEMILEICRFWASKADFNQKTQRYDIAGVMGPDEYHEAYTNTKSGGITNNAYTNLMVAWLFKCAFEIVDQLETDALNTLYQKIELSEKEQENWLNISTRLAIPLSEDDILEQYEGYFKLQEIDWQIYREKYSNISRMDRIFKAEGKNPNHYKVSKQADVLMTFFNLTRREIDALLRQNGYNPGNALLAKNFTYYIQHTSHGSTLSKLVHSNIAMQSGDAQLSYDFYMDALQSDFKDVQGGTTFEGIHTGVMAASALLTLTNYAGLRFDGTDVYLEPRLPKNWRGLDFCIQYCTQSYRVKIDHKKIKLTRLSSTVQQGYVFVNGQKVQFNYKNICEINIKRSMGGC